MEVDHETRVTKSLTPLILLFAGSAAVPAQQTAPEFKAETNLVLVPVVVRDAKGEVVANLGKEDFRLFDNGKERQITSFSLEGTSGRVAEDRSESPAGATPMVMPAHYVALMFDDVHIGDFGDLVYTRTAVRKYLDKLQPADRVAFFTVSGFTNVDFTADRSKITDAMMKLGTGPSGFYGMDPERVAITNIIECDKIVSRMALLPGQRTLVFLSSGLMIHTPTWSEVPRTMRMIDHAIRSRVVISTLDSLGLSMIPDVRRAWEFQLDISDGTGGKFVRHTNDLDGAVEQLAATPKYRYVLGFSPGNIKADGSLHRLTVKLREGRKLDVQARSGYSAPGVSEVQELTRRGPAPPDTAPQLSEAESREVAQALGITRPAPATESHVEKSTQEDLTSKAGPPQSGEPETKEVTEWLNLRPTAPGASTTAPPVTKNDEVVTREQPATFKVQSNLVEVPVVIHDRTGHAVGSLTQQDFHILDKGKRQEISKFTLVKAGQGAGAETAAAPGAPNVSPGAAPPAALRATPDRFVAFLFDDIHLRFEDVPQVRAAVLKYLGTSLRPGDRVALFTTSGSQNIDFTNDAGSLTGPMNKIMPSPIGEKGIGSCGANVSYFQAVQIDREVSLHPMKGDVGKSLALRVAVQEYGDFDRAVMAIRDAFTSGSQESRATLAALRAVVRRMTSLPGQRSLVLVSPGFFVSADLQHESDELMSQAIHAKVLVSAIDARGVWTNPGFDACRNSASTDLARFRDLEGMANGDELIALAEDTGGTLNVNNDFFGGIEKATAAPDFLYVLGFVPQSLKFDGSFHALKVSVAGGEKLSLQARRGYWAPKQSEDGAAVSKQEIEDAVFSRDEINSLPVEMHTQLTKVGEQVKLNVLTSVDLKLIRLRKADDRNRNDVTIVAALFDSNGNFLAGTQKLLELRLRDETVSKLEEKQPVVINTNFDVKPGAYLVRLVARDAEAQEITAENAAVRVQ